jgi:hypothetical protein
MVAYLRPFFALLTDLLVRTWLCGFTPGPTSFANRAFSISPSPATVFGSPFTAFSRFSFVLALSFFLFPFFFFLCWKAVCPREAKSPSEPVSDASQSSSSLPPTDVCRLSLHPPLAHLTSSFFFFFAAARAAAAAAATAICRHGCRAGRDMRAGSGRRPGSAGRQEKKKDKKKNMKKDDY